MNIEIRRSSKVRKEDDPAIAARVEAAFDRLEPELRHVQMRVRHEGPYSLARVVATSTRGVTAVGHAQGPNPVAAAHRAAVRAARSILRARSRHRAMA